MDTRVSMFGKDVTPIPTVHMHTRMHTHTHLLIMPSLQLLRTDFKSGLIVNSRVRPKATESFVRR